MVYLYQICWIPLRVRLPRLMYALVLEPITSLSVFFLTEYLLDTNFSSSFIVKAGHDITYLRGKGGGRAQESSKYGGGFHGVYFYIFCCELELAQVLHMFLQ